MLVRVLTDNDVLHTTQGHVAVGWLIVEDIFTVLVLVVLPAAADILVDGAVELTRGSRGCGRSAWRRRGDRGVVGDGGAADRRLGGAGVGRGSG